jgi:putative peptidoglycan lipid II flippase
VAVLALSLLVPLRRAGVQLRPRLRFPPGIAARARGLAGAGAVSLAAQQVALVVALRLAAGGAEGSVVVFVIATALFLVPWAVLAVPLATSAFPLLAASADAGDEEEFTRVARRSVRAVLVVAAGSAAVLLAVAGPAATLLLQGAPGGGAGTDELAGAVTAFAPGLLGYGLVALLSRALLARGAGRAAAAGTAAGWLTVAVADVALVAALPDADRVVLLGVGNTIGMTVGAVGLLLALARRGGGPALAGAARTAAVAVGAAALAAAVAVALPLDGSGSLPRAVGAGVLLAAVAATLHLAAVRLLDPDGVRSVLRG